MRALPSWFTSWWPTILSSQDNDIGTLWLGSDASQAKSLDANGTELRICFRNHCSETLLLCWMDVHGKPHHFYPLDPIQSDTDEITKEDHVERTQTGHAFLLVSAPDPEVTRQSKSLEGTTLVGAYRPKLSVSSRLRGNKDACENPVHLVTIQESTNDKVGCLSCLPLLRGQRTSSKKDDDDADESSMMWRMTVRSACFDPTPIDTSKKEYRLLPGADWTIHAEPGWHDGDPDLQETFLSDLQLALDCLPPRARQMLRQRTPFWLNRTLKYGPAACPVSGRGMCFHPGADWLRRNGLSTHKHHGIELYNAANYTSSRDFWAPGGLLLHELSHAYHCLCLPAGYGNEQVMECYREAMREGLYEKVRVHGPQGPTAKAYACQDAMEYFAELSTAFLGGTDDGVEFNKWYPFTRKQIREHDPRAFQLLKQVWGVE